VRDTSKQNVIRQQNNRITTIVEVEVEVEAEAEALAGKDRGGYLYPVKNVIESDFT